MFFMFMEIVGVVVFECLEIDFVCGNQGKVCFGENGGGDVFDYVFGDFMNEGNVLVFV